MANDSGVYGRGLTANALKSSLMELDTVNGKSYWDTAAGALLENYEATGQAIDTSFNEAVNEAYASSQKQRYAALETGLTGSGKDELIGRYKDSYEQAYSTYQENLIKSRQANYQSYTEGVTALDEALTARAENYAKFGNLEYDYLQYAWNQYIKNYSDENSNSEFWSDDLIRTMFVTEGTDENGIPILDEKGNPVLDDNGNAMYYNLRTREDLYNTKIGEEGEYLSIYDEDGNLTDFGRTYFDFVENYNYGRDKYIKSFGDWLYETDNELWKYMYEEENPYDESSTGVGNIGTFREATGRSATDATFSIAENITGVPKEYLDKTFDKYRNTINEIAEIGNSEDQLAAYLEKGPDLIEGLKKTANEMGLSNELNHQFDELDKLFTEAKKEYKSKGTLTGEFFAGVAGGFGSAGIATVGGAAAMTAAGGATLAADAAMAGVSVTEAALASNPVGAVILGIITLAMVTAGVVEGSISVAKGREMNKKMSSQLTDAYTKAIENMSSMTLSKKRAQ